MEDGEGKTGQMSEISICRGMKILAVKSGGEGLDGTWSGGLPQPANVCTNFPLSPFIRYLKSGTLE